MITIAHIATVSPLDGFDELPLLDVPARRGRARTGSVDLVVDEETAQRFRAKCAPFADDRGHVWWLGAIDGRADATGGYGRFPAGTGADAVITTAHRFAWTLAHGPIPYDLIVRHRCDELLCVATGHLELGTSADNNWDAVERPVRAADLDTRGSAGRSRAIRNAVLALLTRDDVDSAALREAVRTAMALGDPGRFQLTLWPDDAIWPTMRSKTVENRVTAPRLRRCSAI
jgi:uncharacterized membrane protein